MIRSPSLFRQLVVYLVAILFVGALAQAVVHAFFLDAGIEGSGDFDINEYAVPSVRDMIIKSITRGPDGGALIEPSEALRDRLERDPSLTYAVLNPESCAYLPGSSPDPVAAMVCKTRVNWVALWFNVNDDQKHKVMGLASTEVTPFGVLIVCMRGFHVQWGDLPRIFADEIEYVGMHFGPVFAIAAVIAWFAVRRGLKPLSASAAKLSGIDMESLNQRLPEDHLFIEIRPFVHAVNEALTRLDAGVALQRRFIANAAHQICTPIAILRARLDDPDDESLRRDQRRDLRRLQAIVEQLLVSARTSERGGETKESLDFAVLTRLRIADYTPLARESGRRIDFEGPSSGVMLRGYRQALESVVDNLVDNALRAEPVGGAVVVCVAKGAILEVIDHGEGVAREDRKMIFEPFWRKSEATPGAGLGLAIVKELVELHGGEVFVQETPGGGATFRVVLPAVG